MSNLTWSRADIVADPTDTLSSLAENVASCLYRQTRNTVLMLLGGFKEQDDKEYYSTILVQYYSTILVQYYSTILV
jgi:hypothetical protein